MNIEWIQLIVGIVIGGLVTLGVTHLYYTKQKTDFNSLRKEFDYLSKEILSFLNKKKEFSPKIKEFIKKVAEIRTRMHIDKNIKH